MFEHMLIVTKRDVHTTFYKFPKGTTAEIKCIGNFGKYGLSLEGEALGLVGDEHINVLPFMMVVENMQAGDFEIVTL